MDTAQPLSVDTTDAGGRPPDTLRTAAEVVALLAQVRDQQGCVTLRGSDGRHTTCMLWAVDAGSARLSFSADEADRVLQSLVREGSAQATTQLEGIRIDFEVQGLVVVRSAQSSSLQAALPCSLSRHQRRESFRVRFERRGGPAVRLAHPLRPSEPVVLRVLDISIGGCCLLLPSHLPPLQPGTVLSRAKVDLLPGTRFLSDLVVHSRLPTGAAPDQRLGCEWQAVDGAAQRTLQRYIDDAQRRWRSPFPARPESSTC